MLTSPIVASILAGVAVLALFGALWVVARGAGRLALVRSDLLVLVTQVEQLDTRITREVKTRAGLSRAEGALEDKSVVEQAQAILAKENPPLEFPARPKRSRRNF